MLSQTCSGMNVVLDVVAEPSPEEQTEDDKCDHSFILKDDIGYPDFEMETVNINNCEDLFLKSSRLNEDVVALYKRIEKVELTVKDEKRWEDDISSLLGRMNGAGIPHKDARQTPTPDDFFLSVLALVDRVIWYLLLVGGDRYPVELVEDESLVDYFCKLLYGLLSFEGYQGHAIREGKFSVICIEEGDLNEKFYPKIKEMESCPKKDIPNFKELLQEENFCLTTEEGGQGLLPVLVLSMKEIEKKRRPTIVFLHSTHKCEEWLRPLLEGYASRGYIAVAIDSRYHGERATSMTTYRDVSIVLFVHVYLQLAYTETNSPLGRLCSIQALVSSWKNGDTMPFIFDTIILLRGKMSTHEDRNHWRVSWRFDSELGMHAWFAAFVDTHYSVVVPIVGVQVFGWAVEHDKWQARVNSIKAVFEEARADLDKSAIDKEVVQKRFPMDCLHLPFPDPTWWEYTGYVVVVVVVVDCYRDLSEIRLTTIWRSREIHALLELIYHQGLASESSRLRLPLS
ncbi:putative peroxisomal fatty acid beta-oxidation multifunctional protein AIM1-like isoform X1 [Capsicum annuum]|nr:putative peroxisomal fatty acid beta-oxidation multifunctional protein AIM1-like isoform X1 [Capsicum annuum]